MAAAMQKFQKDVMKGVERGLTLWSAERGLTFLDSIVAGAVPNLPANIRTPIVSIAGATLLKQFMGARIGDMAIAAAFAKTIGSFLDPTLKTTIPQAYVTAGYTAALGMGNYRRTARMGMQHVSRSTVRGGMSGYTRALA